MTRMVQVHGLPLVAVVTKEGFRRGATDGHGVAPMTWLGFWRATIADHPATAVADTIEEACDGAADAYRRAWAQATDQYPVEERAA